MKWLIDGPLAAFDTETTGINVETDRIVTACLALLQPATPIWRQQITSWLINPGMDIPAEATNVHGITTEFARENGEPAPQALDCIAADLARTLLARIPVVVCNGAYDWTILDRECRRHDLPTVEERLGRPIAPVVDVIVLDRWLDPYRKGSRRLDDLRQHYGVRHDGAHDSTADALAAARVAYRIAQFTQDPNAARERLEYMGASARRVGEVTARLGGLAHIDADKLHTRQVEWRRLQCDSLRAHFDAQGTKHDGVPGDWPCLPYRPAPEGVPS